MILSKHGEGQYEGEDTGSQHTAVVDDRQHVQSQLLVRPMQLVRLLELVNNVDELSTAHKANEDHQGKEDINSMTEEKGRVKHVKHEEDALGHRDHPYMLNLATGE